MNMHESAARGFASGSDDYAKGRPEYPPEVSNWLRDVVDIHPAMSVLDMASGTGKFLPILQACGASVVALEPVAAMREQLKARFPDVEVIEGTADAIPLPDGSVDVITCAQAFHWFANRQSLEEFRRVLLPGGVLALVWNVRDESVPWVAALSVITDELQGDTPRFYSGQWRDAFPADGFEFIGEYSTANNQIGSPDDIILKRTLSVSYIAALPEQERQSIADRVRSLIAHTPELANRSQVTFPYVTRMYAYRKTS